MQWMDALTWIWNVGLPAVLTFAAWLVARRVVIARGVGLVFHAVESLYPPGQKPAGLDKTEAAVQRLTDLLGTYWWLPGLTQKELVRVKTTWEAMHATNKAQRPKLVLETIAGALSDLQTARASTPEAAPATPTLDLPALAAQVQALLPPPPPAPAVDHEAVVRAVLARIAGLASAPAPQQDSAP